MGLRGVTAINLHNPQLTASLSGFRHMTVNAVAGIGKAVRFFDMLRAHGLSVIEHVFSEDHIYTHKDVRFTDDAPILMTEKDAVKIRPYAQTNHWYIPVCAVLDKTFAERLLGTLRQYLND